MNPITGHFEVQIPVQKVYKTTWSSRKSEKELRRRGSSRFLLDSTFGKFRQQANQFSIPFTFLIRKKKLSQWWRLLTAEGPCGVRPEIRPWLFNSETMTKYSTCSGQSSFQVYFFFFARHFSTNQLVENIFAISIANPHSKRTLRHNWVLKNVKPIHIIHLQPAWLISTRWRREVIQHELANDRKMWRLYRKCRYSKINELPS